MGRSRLLRIVGCRGRLALKAAFASESSVLHVAGFGRPPAESFSGAEIIAIELSERGMQSVARFISRAYARDGAGKLIELGPGLYPGSRFYAARARYSLVYTCNTWIADVLRAGGCPITQVWGGHRRQPAVPGGALRARSSGVDPGGPRRPLPQGVASLRLHRSGGSVEDLTDHAEPRMTIRIAGRAPLYRTGRFRFAAAGRSGNRRGACRTTRAQ